MAKKKTATTSVYAPGSPQEEYERMEATATQLRAEIAKIQNDLRVGRGENERLFKENLRLVEENRRLRSQMTKAADTPMGTAP